MKVRVKKMSWYLKPALRVSVQSEPNMEEGKEIDGFEVVSFDQLLTLIKLFFESEDLRYPKEKGLKGRTMLLEAIQCLHDGCSIDKILNSFGVKKEHGGVCTVEFE